MVRRRVIALAVAAAFATVASTAFAEQRGDQKNQPKRSKQEQQEIEQVVKIVDGVMAGQPAPTDVTMTLEPFFMKVDVQGTELQVLKGGERTIAAIGQLGRRQR